MKNRLALLLAAALLIPPVLRAQFDLGKLTKALDQAKQAGKVAKGVAGIGPEEEKIIGDAVALELIGKFGGLLRDEAITRRVNLVGRSLTRYSDRPESGWRFGVLASASVNAFSAPDGYVFITRGLYDLAPTDDLLAGILGHEISHITGRHALKIIESGELLGGAQSLLADRSGNFRQAEAQLQQFGPSIKSVLNTLVVAGYSTPTEYAADKNGHDLAALAGYAHGGLRATLVQLQAWKGEKTFSTHPPLVERIKRLPDEPAAP